MQEEAQNIKRLIHEAQNRNTSAKFEDRFMSQMQIGGMLWMISLHLHTLPRRNKWNALVTYTTDPLQQQNIHIYGEYYNANKSNERCTWYIESIQEECGQEYAVVTYT